MGNIWDKIKRTNVGMQRFNWMKTAVGGWRLNYEGEQFFVNPMKMKGCEGKWFVRGQSKDRTQTDLVDGLATADAGKKWVEDAIIAAAANK